MKVHLYIFCFVLFYFAATFWCQPFAKPKLMFHAKDANPTCLLFTLVGWSSDKTEAFLQQEALTLIMQVIVIWAIIECYYPSDAKKEKLSFKSIMIYQIYHNKMNIIQCFKYMKQGALHENKQVTQILQAMD